MRQLDRKPEMFAGGQVSQNLNNKILEQDYDEILDILKESIGKNYGNEEINAALDVVELKRGYETEFEKHMRFIAEREKKAMARIEQQNAFKGIRERSKMDIETLLDT